MTITTAGSNSDPSPSPSPSPSTAPSVTPTPTPAPAGVPLVVTKVRGGPGYDLPASLTPSDGMFGFAVTYVPGLGSASASAVAVGSPYGGTQTEGQVALLLLGSSGSVSSYFAIDAVSEGYNSSVSQSTTQFGASLGVLHQPAGDESELTRLLVGAPGSR